MADSRSSVGGTVLSMIACLFGAAIQLSFEAIVPEGPTNSSVGSANLPGTGKEGAMARTITFLGSFPVTINPPMSTLSPVCTSIRVEMLSNCEADGGVPPATVTLPTMLQQAPCGRQ